MEGSTDSVSRDAQHDHSNHENRTSKTVVLLSILAVSAGLMFLPTPEGMRPEGQRLVGVAVLMAGLWVAQPIPMAATSLLPLVCFPLLGIQSAGVVSRSYINDSVFLYLGGFIIAMGIERWNLHRRMALNMVRLVGVQPKRLVLGFLLATGGLSMWISNTASTLLMLPIALALLTTLDDEHSAKQDQTGEQSLSDRLSAPLLLAIAYSASIGGMTTIIGTPTNNAAVAIYEERVADAQPISVAQWMIACAPIGLVYLLIAWYVLTRNLPGATSRDGELKAELSRRLIDLGKPSTAEIRMLSIFALTAALWIFRKPIHVGGFPLTPGWVTWIPEWFQWLGTSLSAEELSKLEEFVNDSSVSMTMAALMFCVSSGIREADGRVVPLMNWKTASSLPWDIMLLFGGGFALAKAFDTTQLSVWMGEALTGPLQQMPPWLMIGVVCLLMTFLTEFTSNVATVSTLMPTLCAICVALKIDARLLFIPAALATSCAFMLPIATPPNAIVFGSGRISMGQMVRYGIILNLIGVPLLVLGTWLLIKPVMEIPS